MHSEAEEAKDGMILVSRGPAKSGAGMWREGALGSRWEPDGERWVLCSFPCAFPALLELPVPPAVPSPSSRLQSGREEERDPAPRLPAEGCLVDFSGNRAAPVLPPRMHNVLGKALPASGQPLAHPLAEPSKSRVS